MRLLLLALFLTLPLAAEEIELCEEGKKFVYGCDPIDPLYQIRVELSPANGGVELSYSQSPFPPEMKPASGESCQFKKRFETGLKSGTPTGNGVLALATLGTEIRLTNLGSRPVKIQLTGSPAGEPLAKGQSRKFSLTTAQEVRTESLNLPFWRVWQRPEKRQGKVVCTTDTKKLRVKAQVLLLKAEAEEAGLWEEATETPTAPTPSPAPAAATPSP